MIEYLKTFPALVWLSWYYRTKKLLLKNKGKNIKIARNVNIYNSTLSDYNTFYLGVYVENSKISKFVYIASNSSILNTSIGSFTSIGPNCKIGLGRHPIDYISTFPIFFSQKKQCQISFCNKNLFDEFLPIEIGNDVWIGANVTILDGVKIGNGAVIAAGAVINKDIPPYAVVGGVPGRILKYKFSEEKIKFLETFKWWERDIKWIKENAELFINSELFFNKYGK